MALLISLYRKLGGEVHQFTPTGISFSFSFCACVRARVRAEDQGVDVRSDFRENPTPHHLSLFPFWRGRSSLFPCMDFHAFEASRGSRSAILVIFSDLPVRYSEFWHISVNSNEL